MSAATPVVRRFSDDTDENAHHSIGDDDLGGRCAHRRRHRVRRRYILWFNADEAAVSRAEAAGFDTSQLLPASNLLWVAMNGALVVLLGVNIVAVSAWFAMLARPTIAPDGRTH